MPDLSLRDWENHLRRLGAAVDARDLPGAPEGFRAWRTGAPAPPPRRTPTHDELLWRLVSDGDNDWRAGVEHADADAPAPLFGELRAVATIEVWTERELCALHALDRLARRARDAAAHARARLAARWHLEHTQPDNATNRPWAAHVFLLLAHDQRNADARLYAETLIHNCMVMAGEPDPLSAAILCDAADALAEHNAG